MVNETSVYSVLGGDIIEIRTAGDPTTIEIVESTNYFDQWPLPTGRSILVTGYSDVNIHVSAFQNSGIGLYIACFGESGSNVIGSQASDYIALGRGNDSIEAAGGNDEIDLNLWGFGGRNDTIVINRGDGHDFIYNFDNDLVDLSAFSVGFEGLYSLQDVLDVATLVLAGPQDAFSTLIQLDDSTSVTLIGIMPEWLTESSFLFG